IQSFQSFAAAFPAVLRADRTREGKERSPSFPRGPAARSSGQGDAPGGVRKRDEAGHAVRSFHQTLNISQVPSSVHVLFKATLTVFIESLAAPTHSIGLRGRRESVEQEIEIKPPAPQVVPGAFDDD